MGNAGEVSWSAPNGMITTGVKLNCPGGLPIVITVHAIYGHYGTDVVSVIRPWAGRWRCLRASVSQVQVAH